MNCGSVEMQAKLLKSDVEPDQSSRAAQATLEDYPLVAILPEQ